MRSQKRGEALRNGFEIFRSARKPFFCLLVLKDGKNMKELSEKELDKYYNEAKKY